MDLADAEASSKFLNVLNNLDARLETLNQRLQAIEHPKPRHKTVRHHGFSLEYTVDPNGLKQLEEIIVEDGDLLALLRNLSSPCLGRHQPSNSHPERKGFTCPFLRFLPYRDHLLLALKVFKNNDKRTTGSPFSLEQLTGQLAKNIEELLSCLETESTWIAKRRNANAAQGVVLFNDLPSLYAPGMLLIAPRATDEQIVEVSSCDLAEGGTCVIEVWHFRWDGRAFAPTSSRFEVARYPGTRHIHQLLYRPVIWLDFEQSMLKVERILSRNRSNLGTLKEMLEVKPGDSPVCDWHRRRGTVRHHRFNMYSSNLLFQKWAN